MAAPSPRERWRFRPGWRIRRYLLREPLRPTGFALAGFTLVALTADLLALMELLINRGVGPATVGALALYDAIPALSRALPFAVLVGCHVAVGRLGADRELLALEASGLPVPRLVPSFGAFGALGALLALALSLWAAPWAQRGLNALVVEAARRNPGAVLRTGDVHRIGDWTLEAREVSASGEQLRGVVLFVPSIGELVFAERGHVERDPAGGTRVVLQRGRVLFEPGRDGRELEFERTEHLLPDPAAAGWITGEQISAARMSELAAIARGDPRAPQRLEALEEWHRRIALSAAPLAFGLLALPLSLLRSHHSRSGGAALGVGAALAYYALAYLGSGLARGGWLPIGAASWLPNAAAAAAAGLLLVHATDRAGRRAAARGRAREQRADAGGSRKLRTRNLALARYTLAQFARMAALCFGALLAAFLVGDALDNLKWFARYHATGGEILRFFGPRVAVLASRVLPMALLVAAALTMSQMTVQGEILGMRACGVSAGRIARPVLLLSACVALFALALQTEWVPRANAVATERKRTEIKNQQADGPEPRGVWHRVGSQLYQAELLDPVNGEALGVHLYDLDADGLPIRRTDARAALYVGDGLWRLVDPAQVARVEGGLALGTGPRFVKLGENRPTTADATQLTVSQLREVIQALDESGYATTRQRVDLHAKLASPLACFALPAVSVFLALGAARANKPAQALVWSVVVAIGYVLTTGVAAALGYGGMVPPAIGGWAPVVILAGVAAWLALRSLSFGPAR